MNEKDRKSHLRPSKYQDQHSSTNMFTMRSSLFSFLHKKWYGFPYTCFVWNKKDQSIEALIVFTHIIV